jgi:Flp pilus assembly pilin Flp
MPIQEGDSPSTEETMNTIRHEARDERGVALVSYVVLVASIAVVAVVGLSQIGRNVDERFTETNEAMTVEVHGDGITVSTDDVAPTSEDGDLADGDSEASGSGGPRASGSPVIGGGDESADPSGPVEGDASVGRTGDDDGSAPTGNSGTTEGMAGSSELSGEVGEGSGAGAGEGAPDSGSAGSASGTSLEDGESSESQADQSETVGVFGEFSVTFDVVDGKVVVGSVATTGWSYEVTKDNGKQVQMRFTSLSTGGTKVAKGWLTGSGKLKTSVN